MSTGITESYRRRMRYMSNVHEYQGDRQVCQEFYVYRLLMIVFDRVCFFFFCFFFSSRRRHTRYIGDWSSDVCSSDLMDWTSATRPLQHVQCELDHVRGTRCRSGLPAAPGDHAGATGEVRLPDRFLSRSEERRVGKECRSEWAMDPEKTKI